jgi:hypothetical protein
MSNRLRLLVPQLLLPIVGTAACAAPTYAQHAHPTATPVISTASVAARPSITIESPLAGAVVQGVTMIRFRSENISLESPFRPAAQSSSPFPAGHLHVTVDGAAWHWVHATSDPVVITPLPPGEHTVELELAGADHQRLDSRSVRFTVVAKPATSVQQPARQH